MQSRQKNTNVMKELINNILKMSDHSLSKTSNGSPLMTSFHRYSMKKKSLFGRKRILGRKRNTKKPSLISPMKINIRMPEMEGPVPRESVQAQLSPIEERKDKK